MQKSIILTTVFLLQLSLCFTHYNKDWTEKNENNQCPKLFPKNFINYAPIGNYTAGNYTKKSELKGLGQCVLRCCLSETCNVAFLVDGSCFHIECVSDELCLPLLRSNTRKWESQVSMILVKPVLPNENWPDILEQINERDNNNYVSDEEAVYSPYSGQQSQLIPEDEDHFLSRFLSNLPNMDDDETSRSSIFRDNTDGDMLMDASMFLDKARPCGSTDDCPFNYECVPLSIKTHNGICKCIPGTDGSCIEGLRPFSKGPTIDIDALKKSDVFGELKNDVAPSMQNLTVSISNKTVQLPDNEVSLAAFTIPDEKPPNHYSYVWTLVNQPKEQFTGNMKQNGATVTLTDLTEGQYQFKVSVNGTNAYGEGFGNVTVLPAHRINTPPIAIVTPQSQTIKLPNSVAVLDGSSSQDDVGIKSYHWELTAGPLGYQPPLEDKQTLVLKDLKQPGNYIFKLTVEDTDNVKNSTTANITVLNHTDYPPEANAGQDVIIYLPHNELTLNGSLSTDDHEITSWEWTKAAADENKAVDMQNTHSPYLQLSNLSEGMYTFVLKVTDSSGQSSTAEVHVFVKPPTNTPPVADAGADMFISLPQTWVTLNGSASHDDHKIVSYTWTCVEGPNNSTIIGYNESVSNATGLTKGQYVFTLTVVDDNGNPANDNVSVTVAQNKNSPPKADAGGDQVLTLPVPVLVLNGSRSSDDFRIVAWRWTRQPSGMAVGTVIMGSDTQPVLMLTNIEPGRYVFELTVTDDQGESDRDTVSVQVKESPYDKNQLELTLNVQVSAFTQSQLSSLVEKMTLLLKDTRVNVTEVRGEIDSGNTQVIFMLWADNAAVDGLRALSLVLEAGIPSGSRLRTVRCLSTCSGRGRCEPITRTCRCDAFWMQSLWPPRQPQPDCEWSVVYTGLCGVAALGALCGAGSLLARARRRCARARLATIYMPLPRDHEARPFTNKSMSDSETDSDVLFESKQKTSSFITRISNGEGPNKTNTKKNGHYKNSRRLRT